MKEALDDAGLALSQIDGLITSGLPGATSYARFAYRAGLRNVRFLMGYPQSGRMCPVALGHAAMAVHHGLANYVVLFHALNSRSRRIHYGGGEGAGDLYDSLFGMTSPGAFYSLAFTRYQHLYGGTEEQLGAIAAAFRKHAQLNPHGVMRGRPIVIEDYLNSRYIARPLRLLDYCLVNDGAVCYIVTSAERARDLKKLPVLINGFTERAALREWYVADDFWYDACREMAADLFGTAGITTKDIDCIQMYDNFSLSAL
jgi:acetyl-CoA acetyltransferase